MSSHIVIKMRADLRKIETPSSNMRVDARYLDRQTTLRGPNIDDGRIVAPRKLRGDCPGGQQASARHATNKCIQPGLIGVERREVVRFGEAVLRLAGPQGLSQSVPARIHALVQVSEVPADVGRLARIEITMGLWGIVVAASVVSFEQAQRHESV